ncbi:MAG: hypothetical protein BGO69_12585 [Bacteroidetes bacterium 46-16]|jgi:hypothetical protein|uniref:Uncharacterized protein n=1 Tax=Taibaiella soli TaxID=1649169 RepID=A0A2W2A876_9BACT|nr:hypothetical protein [Taibaiella soli]OJW79560.1 MAG: hypothetical protein BGO69_12585 [Bacteroidetes bacterium 46-16]PZF71555.1 hypothetical protein DN068_15890 [Taibaiella soli]
MFTLGQISDSEYNLLGSMNEAEFLGAVEQAPPEEKARFFRKTKEIAKQGAGKNARGSRQDFESRINLLPRDVQKGLANKSLQSVDISYYAVKDITNSKVVKMLRDDDNKSVGYTNISSAKLEKGAFFLLHAIRLTYGISDQGVNNPLNVNFALTPDFIRNGEFEFKANGAVLIPNTSLEVFNTKGNARLVEGTYILDNPKLIRDQQTIEFNLEWGTNAPQNSFLKVILIGTTVVKA